MVNYTRRDFLKAVGLGAAALVLPGCGNGIGQGSGARPNIVLIMADDMGHSDIGCYGGEISTPNLDKLAANGLRFTQFYNMARCCPTRASLLTGLYPHQAGVGFMNHDDKLPGYMGHLADRCVTLAEVLKGAGYNTLMSGKWHVGMKSPNRPLERGFDEYFGILSGAASYFKRRKNQSLTVEGKPFEFAKDKEYYITDAFSDYAAKLVDVYSQKDEPFFLYLAYTAPHWPLHARAEDIAKYRGKYMKGWDALRTERHKRMIEMGIVKDRWPMTPRDTEAAVWDELDEKKKEEMDLKMAIYAAQVDSMDQGIGRVVSALEKSGQLNNTLILFLSDNGGCAEDGQFGFDQGKGEPGTAGSWSSYGLSWANASNTPFRRYKHWVHEGGISTPLIVHWPAVIKQKGKLTPQPGHLIDIMATCCDVAGAEYPATYKEREILALEGKSLLPIFAGKKRKGHKAIYWEHEGNRAVRKGKWKLVSRYPVHWGQVSQDPGRWELYDTEADRTELNDLADKYPEIVKEMSEMYQAWAKRSFVIPRSEFVRRRRERNKKKKAKR